MARERSSEVQCSTLQRTAARCTALQHTATLCNTLQHTAFLHSLQPLGFYDFCMIIGLSQNSGSFGQKCLITSLVTGSFAENGSVQKILVLVLPTKKRYTYIYIYTYIYKYICVCVCVCVCVCIYLCLSVNLSIYLYIGLTQSDELLGKLEC